MILGRCCRCGSQSSSSSSSAGSNSVSGDSGGSGSAGSGSGGSEDLVPCGACYTFASTWQVGIKGEWFEENVLATYAVFCAVPGGYTYHDLFHEVGGPTSAAAAYVASSFLDNDDLCYAWKSSAQAVFVSKLTCDGELIAAVCPINGINQPLVELLAYKLADTTIWFLFYWWTTCRHPLGSFEIAEGYVWSWTESSPAHDCVSTFSVTTPIFTGGVVGNPAYILSATDTSWTTVQITPI